MANRDLESPAAFNNRDDSCHTRSSFLTADMGSNFCGKGRLWTKRSLAENRQVGTEFFFNLFGCSHFVDESQICLFPWHGEYKSTTCSVRKTNITDITQDVVCQHQVYRQVSERVPCVQQAELRSASHRIGESQPCTTHIFYVCSI